jgi:hypothetical protein
MVMQLKVNYEQIIELVDQLSEEQQKALIVRLLTDHAAQRPLTAEEKIQLLDAAKLSNPMRQNPSPRREDWYGDDGR